MNGQNGSWKEKKLEVIKEYEFKMLKIAVSHLCDTSFETKSQTKSKEELIKQIPNLCNQKLDLQNLPEINTSEKIEKFGGSDNVTLQNSMEFLLNLLPNNEQGEIEVRDIYNDAKEDNLLKFLQGSHDEGINILLQLINAKEYRSRKEEVRYSKINSLESGSNKLNDLIKIWKLRFYSLKMSNSPNYEAFKDEIIKWNNVDTSKIYKIEDWAYNKFTPVYCDKCIKEQVEFIENTASGSNNCVTFLDSLDNKAKNYLDLLQVARENYKATFESKDSISQKKFEKAILSLDQKLPSSKGKYFEQLFLKGEQSKTMDRRLIYIIISLFVAAILLFFIIRSIYNWFLENNQKKKELEKEVRDARAEAEKERKRAENAEAEKEKLESAYMENPTVVNTTETIIIKKETNPDIPISNEEEVYHAQIIKESFPSLYAVWPDGDKGFEEGNLSTDSEDNYYYIINRISETEAEYELTSDPEMQLSAAKSADSILSQACEYLNLPRETKSGVETVSNGTLNKEGHEWVIKTRAKIRFI